jgi:hypothetical protein
LYYDFGAPGTFAKRQSTRADFENFARVIYELSGSAAWKRETFVKLSKQYLSGVVEVSMALRGKKPKASTLENTKSALCWWAARCTNAFSSIHFE